MEEIGKKAGANFSLTELVELAALDTMSIRSFESEINDLRK